jgi:DNA-binding PadR family transcriptional regulator
MRFRHGHDHGGHGFGRRFAHGFGRHGGGGLRGRFFDSGDLRLVILALIAEKPRHGYELIKDIEERLSGAYAPSPGVVYPTLTMLEDMGLAVVSAEPNGRKLYALTEAGKAQLEVSRPAVDALFRRMEESSGGGRAAMPQVMRAMHNLRMAMRLRLTRGGLTEEQVRQIVGALDSAAVAIERV